MPTQAEKEARISSGIKQGETLQALADELGVSRQRIHQIMQRLGLHSVRGKTTYLGDDGLNQGERILKERSTRKADLAKRKTQAVELVRNGMSYEKSAKRVGLSVPTVSKACAAAQVNSLQSNETIDRKKKEAIKLLRRGARPMHIATHLDLTPNIVYQLARELVEASIKKGG